MEVSDELANGICCDSCGYPRRGLAVDARCPECGDGPPRLAGTRETAERTRGELAWLRTIAIGLWLLIFASFGALQVALIIPADELALGTVNFPGPKVHAAAMVQRAVGGKPGPWGVAGTFWSMASVLGVWLITERRTSRGDFEDSLALRRITRWTAVLSSGAVLGLLLAIGEPYIPPSGAFSVNIYVIAVAACELPSNLALYLYLRRLGPRLGDRRSTAVLNFCAVFVPVLIAGAVVMLATGEAARRGAHGPWRVMSAAYGAAALAAGVAATAAVGRLAVVATAATANCTVRDTLIAVPRLLRKARAAVDARGPRLCVVAGLLLLLWSVVSNVESVTSLVSRQGLAGDVPFLNFPGPKVMVARAAAATIDRYAYRGASGYEYFWPTIEGALLPALLNLLAVWLVTTADLPRTSQAQWRRAARYAALVAVAGPLGYLLAVPLRHGASPSRVTAWTASLCEAPATCLLYLHLASLAAGPTRRTLTRFAVIAPALIVAPLSAFVLSASMRAWHDSIIVGVVSGVYVATAAAATFVASFAVARLAWDFAKPRRMNVCEDPPMR